MSVDAKIDGLVGPVANFLAEIVFYSVSVLGQDIKIVLVWLVVASIFFTVYLGFVNLRYFVHAIDLVRGKFDPKRTKKTDGQISRFQALTTSLSGTIGLGNIAGVAVAISVGGPGAAFWMFVMGFFAMSTKFAEVTLGVKHRKHLDPDHPENISGGPMYYIRDAFGEDKYNFGKVLAAAFAVCCILGTFGAASMFQTNQSYQQLLNVTGGDASFLADKGWAFGLFMALLTAVVIIGGIKSIANVASKIVPIMGGIYLLAGLVVIGIHIDAVPAAFSIIINSAFGVEAGIGGLMGALLMGVQRAAFSNEAGFGTAAIAHSEAKTTEPVSQGLVGMLGPFVDTIVVCMVTALVIVISGTYQVSNGMEGVELTSRAFESGIPWFPYILAMTVFLFAYSTIIAWSYYGVKCATYLFGQTDTVELAYKGVFLFFIVIGASASLSNVILLTDVSVFAMTVPNVIALYLLAPSLKADVGKYVRKMKLVK